MKTVISQARILWPTPTVKRHGCVFAVHVHMCMPVCAWTVCVWICIMVHTWRSNDSLRWWFSPSSYDTRSPLCFPTAHWIPGLLGTHHSPPSISGRLLGLLALSLYVSKLSFIDERSWELPKHNIFNSQRSTESYNWVFHRTK